MASRKAPSAPVAGVPNRTAQEVRLAAQAFRKLDRATQFRVCREIADTRSRELTLAYKNLVSVGFGYKTRRQKSAKGESVEFRHPCVVFIVSRKWGSKGGANDPQRLPSCLFTYVPVDGKGVLCAVPTDVKPVAAFGARARPHQDAFAERPYGIVVQHDGDSRTAFGVVACAVQRDGISGVFALSCRHVFSMSLQGPEHPSGCKVQAIGGGGELGDTLNIRGALVREPERSFDAQLASVSDEDSLAAALRTLRFAPGDAAALGPEDVPAGFWVITPRRAANGQRLKVWVETRDYVNKVLPYDGIPVMHRHVLHGVASAQLGAGDSGSPAVLTGAGKKLLGMYIGGDGTHAYIIPAWQLLRGVNYGRAAEGIWTVVNP